VSLARNVVLALALGAPLAGLAPTTEAHAQSPASEAVVALPAPVALAEGAPVDLYFAVWSANGQPTAGVVAKATATVGVVEAVSEVAPGLYKVVYRASAAGQAKEAKVTLKGKDPASKRPLEATVTVAIAPGRGAPRVGVSPMSLTLGRDPEATVTVQGASRAGLKVRTSAGTVGAAEQLPGGIFSAKLMAPADRPPRIALVAVADLADPLATATHVALPMSGAIEFPVKGEPGASVLLELGSERFGPVVLGADGKGRVPIVVPPGVSAATKVSTKDGSETRESIDLKIPEAKRLLVYPLPAALPADRREVPLRVIVVKPDGSPDPDAKPTFTVSAGVVGAVEGLGGGVFRAKWTLPESGTSATVTASLGSPLQTDAVDVALTVPLPSAITVSSSPETVSGTAPFRVVVAATRADGSAYDRGEPVVDFDGAKGEPAVREATGWSLRAEPTAEGPIRATAHWKVAASPNPATTVALVPERLGVNNDGAAKVEVLVLAVDAAGQPVADRKVELSVDGGGGKVEPASVTTGADGTARVTYTSGSEAGYVGVRARSVDLDQLVVLGQFPDGKPPVPPPPSRTPALAALVPTLRIPRSEGPAVAIAPVASPVQKVNLSVEGVAGPGATVVLVASAVDGTGQVLGAFAPTLTASAGTLSPPETAADGTVRSILSIPADHRGSIDVSAAAGGRTAKVVVGQDDDVASAWGVPAVAPVAPVPPVPPVPAAPAPVPEIPEPPRAATEHPWLRVRGNGVFGTYRYTQAPSQEPGPVLPATLSVGGPDGGAPATPVGAEGDARVWLDAVGVPYVGFHGQVRGAAYSIASEAFSNAASDVLWNGSLDAVGRYPFELGGHQYWVGAKAGFQYGDFLTFLGDLTPGSTIRFLGLEVPGMGVGPELGADIGPVHVIAGYTLGLARGSQPYSNAVDLEVGWAPVEHLFLSGGLSTVTRGALLTGADSGLDRGTIDDASLAFKLGVGVSL
jgi:hypothetical protein